MQFLMRLTNRKLILLLIICTVICAFAATKLNQQLGTGYEFTAPFTTSAETSQWLNNELTTEKRTQFTRSILIWDSLFPLGVSLLFAVLIAAGIRSFKSTSPISKRRWQMVSFVGGFLCLLAFIFDISENQAAVALVQDPTQEWSESALLIQIFVILNRLKWICFMGSGLMASIALLRLINIAIPLLFHVRFAILVVLFGTVLTLSVDQIMELFYSLSESVPSEQRRVLLWTYLMTAILGFSLWFVARTIFRFELPLWGEPDGISPDAQMTLNMLREWLPRILGTSVPVLMAIGCFIAQSKLQQRSSLSLFAWGFLGLALVLYLFFRYRRSMGLALKSSAIVPKWVVNEITSFDMESCDFQNVRELPKINRVMIILVILANLAVLIISAKSPQTLIYLGPLGLILLSAVFFTITGSVLTFFASRWNFPLLTLLLVLAMIFHSNGLNDNHQVRQCQGMNSTDTALFCPYNTSEVIPQRAKFSNILAKWAEQDESQADEQNSKAEKPDSNNQPIFLVSAAGGGIRAAAWTAMVLSRLEDESNGSFSQHMIFGSGVSGGSLGLSTYLSLLKVNQANPSPIFEASTKILGQDFLTPVLVKLLFADQFQRFIPGAWFIDRGQALEQSWEQAFAEVMGDHQENPLAAPFSALYDDPNRHLPYLFLNATVVQNGFRFIQHPFDPIEQFQSVFPASMDSAECFKATTPLSAVTHNSARFTFVSPAGTVPDCYPTAEGKKTIQVVDGGYFENSGAETLADLYREMIKSGIDEERIHVIHISNDTSVTNFTEGAVCAPTAPQISVSGEITAPIGAILKTRQARGANARYSLPNATPDALPYDQTQLDCSSQVYHFRLCDGDWGLPLGWTLAEQSIDELERQLNQQQALSQCILDVIEPQPEATENQAVQSP